MPVADGCHGRGSTLVQSSLQLPPPNDSNIIATLPTPEHFAFALDTRKRRRQTHGMTIPFARVAAPLANTTSTLEVLPVLQQEGTCTLQRVEQVHIYVCALVSFHGPPILLPPLLHSQLLVESSSIMCGMAIAYAWHAAPSHSPPRPTPRCSNELHAGPVRRSMASPMPFSQIHTTSPPTTGAMHSGVPCIACLAPWVVCLPRSPCCKRWGLVHSGRCRHRPP